MTKEDKVMKEMKYYVGIIIKHFDAKIDTVIEGHQLLHRRIDGLEYAIGVMRKDFDIKFKILADKMDSIALRVDDHEERITNLEAANT